LCSETRELPRELRIVKFRANPSDQIDGVPKQATGSRAAAPEIQRHGALMVLPKSLAGQVGRADDQSNPPIGLGFANRFSHPHQEGNLGMQLSVGNREGVDPGRQAG
jgi:hypothetical protein